MRTGQFGSRKPRNVVGGGKRRPSNEFNSGLKRERRPDPPQFSSPKVKERKQFSESRDARPGKSASGSPAPQGRASRKNASRKRTGGRNRMSKFVQQAVGMAAGAVVVTTSYQNMVEAREAKLAEDRNAQAVIETVTEGQGFGGNTDGNANSNDSSGETARDSTSGTEFPGGNEDSNVEKNSNEEEDSNEGTGTDEVTNNGEDNSTGGESSGSEGTDSGDDGNRSDGEGTSGPEGTTSGGDGNNSGGDGGSGSGGSTSANTGNNSASDVKNKEWKWDEEKATLLVTDGEGKVHRVTGKVTKEETSATCTQDGEIKYTAAAEYKNKKYTDTKTKKLAATGHQLDEGKVTSKGGKTVCEYHCESCGEKFVVELTIDEDD